MLNKIRISIKKTYNNFKQSFPILFGIIFLVSFFQVIIPKDFYSKIFTGSWFFDSFLGSLLGSVSSGNPVTSYVIAGELLKQNIVLVAVIAFILSWVTVGIIQLPAESLMLGKKFAITRNVLAFISSIIISILTVLTLSIL